MGVEQNIQKKLAEEERIRIKRREIFDDAKSRQWYGMSLQELKEKGKNHDKTEGDVLTEALGDTEGEVDTETERETDTDADGRILLNNPHPVG